jgi:hypothetical protein
MERYSKLTEWLNNPKLIVLSFEQIEEIIGDKLPDSATDHRPWWGNENGNPSRQCHAWLDAGWEVDRVDLKARIVRFRKL